MGKYRLVSLLPLFLAIAAQLCSCDRQDMTPTSGTLVGSLPKDPVLTDMRRDSAGLLWIATEDDGVYLFDGTQGVHFLPDGSPGAFPSNYVNSILTDTYGAVWFGTREGVCRFKPETVSFEEVVFPEPGTNILKLMRDRYGKVIAVTFSGLFRFDEQIGGFRKFVSLYNTYVRNVFLDDVRDRIVVVGSESLELYDTDGNLAGTYPAGGPIVNSYKVGEDRLLLTAFPKKTVFNLSSLCFEDMSSSWDTLRNPDLFGPIAPFGEDAVVFTYGDRLYEYDFDTDRMIDEDDISFPFHAGVPGEDIKDILPVGEDETWIVSYAKGLSRTHIYSEVKYRAMERFIVRHNVRDLCSDGRFVWMIADGVNLVSFEIESGSIASRNIGQLINRYVRAGKSCSLLFDRAGSRLVVNIDNNLLELTAEAADKLRARHLYTGAFMSPSLRMAVDREGRIWSGGRSGDLQYVPQTPPASFVLQQDTLDFDRVPSWAVCTALIVLKDGRIAAAFDRFGIALVDPETRQTRVFDLSETFHTLTVSSICQGDGNYLWIGTGQDGVFYMDLSSGSLSRSSFFRGNSVSRIARDRYDRMYVVADGSLFYSSPDSHRYQLLQKGIPHSQDALWMTERDEILAVLGNRFFAVSPGKASGISRPEEKLYFVLSDERGRVLALKPFSPDTEDKVRMCVSPSYHSFSVAVLSFGQGQDGVARYVKGHDQRWLQLNAPMRFSLDRLGGGTHRILINSFEIPDLDNGSVVEFDLTVRNPWYLTGVAKALYLLLLCGLVLAFLHMLRANQRARVDKEVAIREKEMQERLNQQNLDLFADLSHEFRTPLTIISGASDMLLRQYGADSQQSRLVHSVQRSADRMMKLVGQLIDFNKIKHDQLQLRVQPADAAGLVRSIVAGFESAAQMKDIAFTVDAPDSLIGYIDGDKVEKIVFNLLSNAIKYTPSGGAVTVSAQSVREASGDRLLVQVSDTGIGIPDDKKSAIFERFARVGAGKDAGGFGVGLFFARKLAEIHHGSIRVDDRKDEAGNCAGSVFSLSLPLGHQGYSPEEVQSPEEDTKKPVDIRKYLSEYTSRPVPESRPGGSAGRILVIDDDSEILYYLKLVLSPEYEVIVCSDAMSGYKKIDTDHPDMIISDVMMVETDGIKLCGMVKGNPDMCHIPFILLTAKSTVQDQIAGLDAGADAYVVKPFEPDYLRSVISSLFRARDYFRKALGSQTSIKKVDTSSISETDRILLDRMYQIMAADLTDTELNISKICQIVGVSRTKLYYKIKDLTGQTPNDFFKTYKLNRAAEMLKEGKLKISAISDMVGFSSASHFASAFKKQFGVLPSKY